MAAEILPSWSKDDGSIISSYNFPNRICDAQIYPTRAPNGSDVIVYGQEHNLVMLWRGGRPFRKTKKPGRGQVGAQSSVLPPDGDTIMIDSDNEDPPVSDVNGAFFDTNAFEEYEEETDRNQPVEPIIAAHKVPFESPIIHVVAPTCAPSSALNSHQFSNPPLLNKHIVLSVACSDSSVHVVTVPLVPPNDKSIPKSAQDSIVPIVPKDEAGSMATLARGLSMAWTARDVKPNAPTKEQVDRSQASAHAGSHSSLSGLAWSLLVALHSSAASGLLYIYQIQLDESGESLQTKDKAIKLLRRENLPCLARTIEFCPSRYPSSNHTKLLLSDVIGNIRVYDICLVQDRHISQLTSGPDASMDVERGQWLITLHPTAPARADADDYENLNTVLDAQWILSGRAIIVLLRNGHWGLWDLSRSAPFQKASAGDKAVSSTPQIGGSTTTFAVSGSLIENLTASTDAEPANSRGITTKANKKLAPMTPSTRKEKQKTLFAGSEDSKTTPAALIKGGMAVVSIASEHIAEPYDDAVLFWYNSSAFYLPGVLSFWKHSLNKPTSRRYRLQALKSLNARGELASHGSLGIPKKHSNSKTKQDLRHVVLVCAETRFLVMEPYRDHPEPNVEHAERPLSSAGLHDFGASAQVDQELLKSHDLHIGGLDRMLSSMEQSVHDASRLNGPSMASTHERHVEFANN